MPLVARVLITVVLTGAVVAAGALASLVAAVIVQGGLECHPRCRDAPALLVMLVGLAISLAAGAAVGRAVWRATVREDGG